jgi:type IV secretion system protein VirB10
MTPRTALAGERTQPIAEPGAARRVASYRLVFGLCLAVGTAVALWVTYWHHHHPQVTPTARAPKSRAAATEMRLPKLALDEPAAAPSAAVSSTEAAPVQALAVPPAVPSLPGSSLTSAAPAGGTRRTPVSPVLLEPTGREERATLPATSSIEAASARASVKVLHAQALPALQFLLPRGSFLDCTLETAVDSTLPGLATCMLSGDVYGADGKVVLLPRGSRLVGDVRSDVRAGQARVGIIWTEARTPQGLLLPLGAAGTDALGRTGVPGVVDRHSVERFGSAVMLSVIDAAASALVNRRTPGTGVVYNIQGSRDVATEALRQSIHIPPTIRVEPGARVDVIVAADVDFADVYRLVSRDGN